MATEPGDHNLALDELKRRLGELEKSRRQTPPYLDRIVSRLGEAEIAAGTLMLLFSPFETVSIVLGTVGAATWVYDRFIKEPRETRNEIEQNRQIDLIQSEIDRLARR